MLESLLEKSINRIDSIKKYYLCQRDSILQNMDVGFDRNILGFEIKEYLQYMVTGKALIDIPNIKEKIESYIEIDSIAEDKTFVKFHYIDLEKLKNRNIELNPEKAKREFLKCFDMPVLLEQSIIIMLVIRFEEIISHLFDYLINKYQNAYLPEKRIKYSVIMETGIENITKLFVKQEVESIMRENISCWLKLIADKHTIDFNILDDYLDEYYELYYRRNIIVHNNGIVNDDYIKGVKEGFRRGLKLGDKAVLTAEYLENAISLSSIIIYGIFISLLKIMDNGKDFIGVLFTLGFEHMLDSEWEIGKFIFRYLSRYKDQTSIEKTQSLINYWICIKNRDGLDNIYRDVENADFTAMQNEFKIAKLMVLDNFDEANELIERSFPIFNASSFETWPLFIQYRQSPQYDILRESHKDFFKLKQVDSSDNLENLELLDIKEYTDKSKGENNL